MDRICREIDELRDYEHEIELALGAVHGRLKWLRAPNAFLLRREVNRRIQTLQSRHNIVHNCYVALKKAEDGASKELAGETQKSHAESGDRATQSQRILCRDLRVGPRG